MELSESRKEVSKTPAKDEREKSNVGNSHALYDDWHSTMQNKPNMGATNLIAKEDLDQNRNSQIALAAECSLDLNTRELYKPHSLDVQNDSGLNAIRPDIQKINNFTITKPDGTKISEYTTIRKSGEVTQSSSIEKDNWTSIRLHRIGDTTVKEWSSNKGDPRLDKLLERAECETSALAIFNRIDKDRNGYLHIQELAKAIEAPSFKYDDAQILAGLYHAYRDISNASNDEWGWENDGITAKDLQKYFHRDDTDVYKTIASTYRAGLSNDSLFAGDSQKNIVTQAVTMTRLENCYFMGALGSVAAVNPQSIKDMIQDNANDTFTVTFPGAPDHPITIDRPTQAERGLYYPDTSYGIWPVVIEKAFGAYCQQFVEARTVRNLSGGYTTMEGSDGGAIRADIYLQLLTGGSVAKKDAMLSLRELGKCLNNNPHKAVLVGTLAGLPALPAMLSGSDSTVDGFPFPHIFSVVAYDPKGPDGGTVTIKDPNDRFNRQISFKKFGNNFETIFYQE